MNRVAQAILFAVIAIVIAANPLFAQSEWSAVRPMPMVTLQIRKLVGLLMLAPAVTLFLLYLFRPRPYVLAGMTSWFAGSVMMLVLSFDSGHPDPRTARGPSRPTPCRRNRAVAALAFGAGIRLGGAWFRAPAVISRGLRWGFPLAMLWTLAAATFLGPRAVVVPAFVMMSLWQAHGEIAYLSVARTQRMVGPLLTGLGVAGMVTVNTIALGVAATTGGIGDASTRVAYFNFASAALLVLGMHLLIFEDVIHELRTAAAELATSRDEMKTMAVTDPLTQLLQPPPALRNRRARARAAPAL